MNINHYKKYIEMLDIEDATHKVRRGRGIGYWQECIILRYLPGNRVKLLVFVKSKYISNLFIKRIIYIDKDRIREMY